MPSRHLRRFVLNRIPTKVMLIGEYAVLAGLPTTLIPLKSHFLIDVQEVVKEEKEENEALSLSSFLDFHPESPAGILLKKHHRHFKYRAQMSTQSKAIIRGLGSSTAEFIAVWATLSNRSLEDLKREATQVHALYQECVPQASGADLMLQLWNEPIHMCRSLKPQSADVSWLLKHSIFVTTYFQENRKTATHEDLISKSQMIQDLKMQSTELTSSYQRMKQLLDEWMSFFETTNQRSSNHSDHPAEQVPAVGQIQAVGEVMNRWADLMQELGCEQPQTTQDRIELKQIPGVVAVKGCGAMGSDVLWILLQPHLSETNKSFIQSKLKAMGLYEI